MAGSPSREGAAPELLCLGRHAHEQLGHLSSRWPYHLQTRAYVRDRDRGWRLDEAEALGVVAPGRHRVQVPSRKPAAARSRLNSAVSGLSPTTCRNRAGHTAPANSRPPPRPQATRMTGGFQPGRLLTPDPARPPAPQCPGQHPDPADRTRLTALTRHFTLPAPRPQGASPHGTRILARRETWQ